MSYDSESNEVSVSAKYYLSSGNSIVCLLEIQNIGAVDRTITIHAVSS